MKPGRIDPNHDYLSEMTECHLDFPASNEGIMPKPTLKEPFRTLESQIIDTLLAGHHEYRPDLPYPESHSDMAGAVRGLLVMFDVTRRPLPRELPFEE